MFRGRAVQAKLENDLGASACPARHSEPPEKRGAMDSRFYPYHGDAEEYPEHLAVDFRKLRVRGRARLAHVPRRRLVLATPPDRGSTKRAPLTVPSLRSLASFSQPAALTKYCREFDVPSVREGSELAAAVGRHFETTLDVDEDECITRFLGAVRHAYPGAKGPAGRGQSRLARALAKPARDGPLSPQIRRTPGGQADVATARTMARDRQAKAAQTGASLDREYAAPAMYGGYAAAPPQRSMAAPYAMPVDVGMGGYSTSGYGVAAPDDMGHEAGAQPEGQMIGCDNDNCPRQWWSLLEVGLVPETVPTGKWFCPECRESPTDHSVPRSYRGRKAARGARPKPPKRLRRR